jgi:hypothetical protein
MRLVAFVQHDGKDYRPEEEHHIHVKDTQCGFDKSYVYERGW